MQKYLQDYSLNLSWDTVKHLNPFTRTKNVGEMQVGSGFNLGNTFHMCNSTPDTEAGQIQVKMVDKRLMQHDDEA